MSELSLNSWKLLRILVKLIQERIEQACQWASDFHGLQSNWNCSLPTQNGGGLVFWWDFSAFLCTGILLLLTTIFFPLEILRQWVNLNVKRHQDHKVVWLACAVAQRLLEGEGLKSTYLKCVNAIINKLSFHFQILKSKFFKYQENYFFRIFSLTLFLSFHFPFNFKSLETKK